MSAGKILVVDVGTSSVRSSIVTADSEVTCIHQAAVLPSSPNPGEVELDADAIKQAVLSTARAALADGGPVSGVGIANQRASTVVWDAETSQPIGPGIGWQDLRTVINCLLLQAEGLRLAPNMSATKLQWLLDTYDPERKHAARLRFGTIDTWVAWVLSDGSLHVTDPTNAGVTGLVDPSTTAWDEGVLATLNVPASMMPTIVDSSGAIGPLSALDGAPILCGIAGDQQASLIGQGCTSPGLAKITFGTGGMLDVVVGPTPPVAAARGERGTFPIVTSRRGGTTTWGIEAIMLSAGACVETTWDCSRPLATLRPWPDPATPPMASPSCRRSSGLERRTGTSALVGCSSASPEALGVLRSHGPSSRASRSEASTSSSLPRRMQGSRWQAFESTVA